jgi:hypothetical protein
LDCACYSKNFNEALNVDLNVFSSKDIASTDEESAINFVLYGSVIGVCDHEPYVYIPYYIRSNDKWLIRMYCINKMTATIDHITIDSVAEPVKANVFVLNNYITIVTEFITYSISYDYTISANAQESVVLDYETYWLGQHVTVMDGIATIGADVIAVAKDAQYSIMQYNSERCFGVYKNNLVSVYDLGGTRLGSSVSDAKAVYFFIRNINLMSVEAHDNFMRIKLVES